MLPMDVQVDAYSSASLSSARVQTWCVDAQVVADRQQLASIRAL